MQIHHIPRLHTWVPIVVGPFTGAFLLIWILPSFLLGFLLMWIAYLVPLGLYIFAYRNPRVEQHVRLLTPGHLRFWLAEKLQLLGIRMAAEAPAAHETGPDLQLLAVSAADPQENQARLITARQLPGYTPVRTLLDHALGYRAAAVMLDYGESVAVRYLIDGVWLSTAAQSREIGDQLLEVLKTVAGLDADQPTPTLGGRLAMQSEAEQIPITMTWQTTAGGQRVLLQFQLRPAQFNTLQDLGMTSTQEAELQEILAGDRGILLFSALPSGGLSTTLERSVMQIDRLLRDCVSVEDGGAPYPELTSVDVKTYDRAAGQTPASILPSVGRAQPDLIICRDLVDAESVALLCQQAIEERRIITTIQARDSVEALLRVLMLKVPRERFAQAIQAVLHQRLIRKLCEPCREAYTPQPQLLAKLGLNPAQVPQLYRPPAEPEKVCSHCNGLGYYGRTAIFELLRVDDQMRKILKVKPELELLRKAARQAGLRSEQQHGILKVAQGITSLEELQRVLKT
ncbi:MAG: hypothetical protein GTO03_15160 [Planctomycetales bacterium]|nr:hypothetical protein [Planctomycetales bacterium]